MNDQDTYNLRTLILSHDGDCFHHIDEMRRWKSLLMANAKSKHKDILDMAELAINLDFNDGDYWRPWERVDDSYDYFQGATNAEYKEILKKMIFNCEDNADDKNKKKKIMLIKQTVMGCDAVEVECWIRLTNPADEINLEIIHEKKNKEIVLRKKNHVMAVSKLRDNFFEDGKTKKKIGKTQDTFNHGDKNKKKISGNSKKWKEVPKWKATPIRHQKTRRVYIQTLHNITFGKSDHFGL